MTRFIGYLLVALIVYTLQVSLFSEFLVARIRPDLSILLILFIALNEDITMGAILAFIFGIMKDSLAGGNPGLFGFSYLLLFFIATMLFNRLNPESAPLLVVLSFFGVILEGAFVVVSLLFAAHTAVNWSQIVGSVVGQAAATALVCGVVLWLVVFVREHLGVRLPFIGLKYLEDEYECDR